MSHECSPSDYLDRWSIFASTNAIPNKGRFWKVMNVYLSEVCLAAHLEPRSSEDMKGAEWKPAEAKEELSSLLRRLKYLAMDHDIYYPVVGVIDRSPSQPPKGWGDGGHVARWIADQEWHRGAFLLYLEKDDSEGISQGSVRGRLRDLLGGEPMGWPEERETEERNCEYFSKKIEEAFEKTSPRGDLATRLAHDLFGVFKAACSEEDTAQINREDAFKAVISGWVDNLIRQAKETAQGWVG